MRFEGTGGLVEAQMIWNQRKAPWLPVMMAEKKSVKRTFEMLSRRGIQMEIQVLERVGEAMICASGGQSAFGKVGHQRTAVGGQQGVAQVLARSSKYMRGLAAFYGECSKLPNRDSWPGLQPHLLPYDGMTNEKHHRFSSAETHRPQARRAILPAHPTWSAAGRNSAGAA